MNNSGKKETDALSYGRPSHRSMDIRFYGLIDCLDRHHPQLPKMVQSKGDGRRPFFKEEVSKPSVLRDVPVRFRIAQRPDQDESWSLHLKIPQ